MRARILFVLALLGLFAFATQKAWAITAYDPTVDASEDMEHDTDTWTPSDNDPINDPDAGGDTPGADASHLGGPPDNIAGQDWFDARNGGNGIIEEVATLSGVIAPNGSYNGHAAPPHSAGNFAIVQFDSGDGPFGRQNRQFSVNPVPTGGAGSRSGYWATQDLYINPATAYGGPDGIPDFWFTNAVNGTPSSPAAGSYLSESGMTGSVDPSGLTWTIATTNGVFLATVPVGTWIGYEMEPIMSILNPGLVAFEHRVYADGGTHGVLIGTAVVEDYVGGALGGWADLSGPRYNWYTFPTANMGYLYVDNVGWTNNEVPEPSTLVLAGLGALGLAFVAKRRRHARA